ncbi:MAG: CDP-glycerol glycerophosphotransferase family protein [Bacteroidota bacterium]
MKKNKYIERVTSFLSIVLGWLIVAPLSLFFPRKKGLITLIGRNATFYSDNTKYFNNFLLNIKYKDAYFLFEKRNSITESVPNHIYYPGLKAIYILLRSEYLIVDTSTWFYNLKYFFAVKSKKIQLWHGVSSKKIEMSTEQFQRGLLRNIKKLYGILRGQLIRFRLIVSTSDYYTKHLYSDAFRYHEILPLGQPRTDIFFRELNALDFINTDKPLLDRLMQSQSREKNKIILYTPTYRDYLSMDLLDFELINRFCRDNNMVFVLKYHILSSLPETGNYSNVFVYDQSKDIYPLMTITDVMVTDYSSIYLDYLLTDKPVIFYVPDYEDYQKHEVGLRPDFYETSPGNKILNQDDLMQALLEINNGADEFAKQRKQILDLSFKHKDGKASRRLFDYLAQ